MCNKQITSHKSSLFFLVFLTIISMITPGIYSSTAGVRILSLAFPMKPIHVHVRFWQIRGGHWVHVHKKHAHSPSPSDSLQLLANVPSPGHRQNTPTPLTTNTQINSPHLSCTTYGTKSTFDYSNSLDSEYCSCVLSCTVLHGPQPPLSFSPAPFVTAVAHSAQKQ